ncbi:MAG: bifunctional 3-deoxy-7-phosphoheptulonate synthase/chorismate mutase type II [Saprospiraceae bacterium]|nr:bifunctional 3-deoxy-7-phosphoheptulonate synthase/chorismate mutase type II [Saprospiraceae bacterium]
MDAAVVKEEGSKIMILGPCSAESEQQMLSVAAQLKHLNPDYVRAGLWKPRTRPGSFEGFGTNAIAWLKAVQRQFGLKVCTEVANTQHVEIALKAGIDAIWIGARTTVNPFYVHEIASVLKGVDIPVFVKNPMNPDLHLWQGAIERILNVGIQRIAAIHRGFSFYGNSIYRNVPRWQIPIELMRRLPGIQMIADISHIGGHPGILREIAQIAFDLNYDGIMAEVHPDPLKALSDAEQQVTPLFFEEQILNQLIFRKGFSHDDGFNQKLNHIRREIDAVDSEIVRLLARRMLLAEDIGIQKKIRGVSIFQPDRWEQIVARLLEEGKILNLSEEFIFSLIEAIHIESIQHQSYQMNRSQEHSK